MIVLLAVGLAVAFKEVPRPYLLLAMGTDKVFGVPRLPHRCNNLNGGG